MADQKAAPPKPANPALRMMGLPSLPRKLPSRNWLIFWGVSTTLAAAIIYDRREKKRATARWAKAVEPLSKELLSDTSAMPRKVTVYLESPPGDGLRSAQDHFKEYIKPVLAASGLDWEFVVGRRQGDVRAVVAERIRRARRADRTEVGPDAALLEGDAPTDDDVVMTIRQRNGIPEYAGVKGDIVVGRHTWKEYVRGLHEGWLGPLVAPPPPVVVVDTKKEALTTDTDVAAALGTGDAPKTDAETETPREEKKEEPKEEKKEEPKDDDKPKRPPQPVPYNAVTDYPSSPLPRHIPAELGPSSPIPFPHLLGFLNTPIRIYRFLNRRKTADEIGREVAAVCFAHASRAYRETSGADVDGDAYEQQTVLAHEEKDWTKSVWTDDKEALKEDPSLATREKPWRNPVVVDPRIGQRMRRFELTAADEEAARAIKVPEEEIEGWTKGKFRQLGRWAVGKWRGDGKLRPNVGNLDGE